VILERAIEKRAAFMVARFVSLNYPSNHKLKPNSWADGVAIDVVREDWAVHEDHDSVAHDDHEPVLRVEGDLRASEPNSWADGVAIYVVREDCAVHKDHDSVTHDDHEPVLQVEGGWRTV